jgi:redox-sensitive bicupin YhaK (pirin superfamily)
MDGTFVHQDSAGGGGSITDGDTQWMTAGAGILHIETPPESLVVSGGLFHGIQLWVNLPRAKKMTAPRYQDIGAGNQVLLASHDGGALVRLIAGDLGGHGGSAQTHTPMTMLHGTVSPGSELVLPWPAGYNALVYGLSGYGSVGPDRRPFRLGQLAALGGGDTITVAGPRVAGSDAKPLDVLILGGRPLREPVAKYGPFVMNTAAEVQTAFDDFRAGRLGRIPADHISR